MTISRRALLAGCSAAALSLPRAAPAESAVPLAIAGVAEDSATPVIYGAQSGIFARNGLDVKFSAERSGPAIVSGVLGGAYQIGKSSITPLIAAHVKGIPIAIVAPGGMYVAKAPIDGMFVRTESTVKTAADLNGKTFGVYGLGDIYSVSTKVWMQKNGGDPASIKLVEIPISAMVEAIESGRIDAGSMNEPVLQIALSSPKLRLLAHPLAAVAPQFLYTAWFASIDYATKNRSTIGRFAKTMRQLAAFANGHHDQTVAALASVTSVDAAVIRKMTRVEDGVALEASAIQPVIDAMAAFKDIPAAFDARDLIEAGLR